MSQEEADEKKKLSDANDKIAKMLEVDEKAKEAKEAALAKTLADAASAFTAPKIVEEAQKEFDAQAALQREQDALKVKQEQIDADRKDWTKTKHEKVDRAT